MLKPRDIAYCAVFGAAAMLLPVIFHVFHLGSVFMPMYLPLVSLSFFVGPVPAALTALLLPLLSGAITGMPPFYPPIAFMMSVELATMCGIIACVRKLLPKINELIILIPVLILGRCIGIGLIYLMALFMNLPPTFIVGASILSGWPGIILMIVAIPAIIRISRMVGYSNMKTGDSSKPTIAAYFNSIAPNWDSWEDLESLKVQFDNGLKRFGLRPDEHILDVGCGTGNLTAAILRQLSQAGRITAVDISSQMIEIAQTKVNDSRVQWICDSIEHMTTFENVFDRAICYSVWPHLTNSEVVARLIQSMLKPNGKIHVWHLRSRQAINKTHAGASEVIRNHMLVPASQTATLLEKFGFIIEEMLDDDSGYLVSARKTRS